MNSRANNVKYSLVLQSFGQEHEYRRALLCLYSFFHFVDENLEKVILFTDKPEFFKSCLRDSPLHLIPLTPEKIKNMKGEIDFLHRMKIVMIEEAFQQTSGNLLYVDSDTIFINNPSDLMSKVSPSVAGMHLFEYKFTVLKAMPLPAGTPFHAFYDLISTNKFKLASGKTVQFSTGLSSWNAGAMAFHYTHKNLLPDVYALTEQFYPPTLNHASEQYAFSLVLQQQTQILTLHEAIFHYWYRVKKVIVDDLLARHMDKNFFSGSHEQRQRWASNFCVDLPHVLEHHILTLRDNSIQAFHEDNFEEGFRLAFRSLVKNPFNKKFLLDLGYHTRRWLRKFLTKQTS